MTWRRASIPPHSVVTWRRAASRGDEQFMTRLIATLLVLLGLAAPAFAHPHVFVAMKSELIYDADGKVTAIRQAWTFDDMFSAYATQGLESKVKGQFTREELAPLAEVNVTNLKEYGYFTQGTANGGKIEFADVKDYWLDYKDTILTLHFTMPLKTPVKAKTLKVEIYDPEFFIDFGFEKKDPVRLVSAPAQCKLDVAKQGDLSAAGDAKRLSEAFFNKGDNSNFGAQFSNTIAVTCP
jgi:ABC-type uncharacterized transport system substrate-binding protein